MLFARLLPGIWEAQLREYSIDKLVSALLLLDKLLFILLLTLIYVSNRLVGLFDVFEPSRNLNAAKTLPNTAFQA